MRAILDEVRSLDLPKGGYVVVGSGPLSVRNIRPHKDIDLLVTEDVFEKLLLCGWEKEIGPNGRPKAKRDIFEAFTWIGCGSYQPQTTTLIQDADLIDGIPFLKLDELMIFKRAVGREKDFQDIQLILNFLQCSSTDTLAA